jgi:hypothetical protein
MSSLNKKPTLWSIILVPVAIAAIMTPAILLAAGSGSGQGFDAVVRTIELRYHAHATKIPFMGLISGIAGLSTHGGVHGLHVAEFEHFRADEDTRAFDGSEFNDLVEQHVGPGWQRMIRETSREHDGARGEQTLIYVRPDGKNVAMLVVDLDGNDLDVVQLSMNPEQLMNQVNEHRHHHGDGNDDHNDDSDHQNDHQNDHDGAHASGAL